MSVQHTIFPAQQTLLTGSDTAIIVLHEIYGINRHITEVCQRLHATGYDIYCPHFLGVDKPFDYSQQEEAYHYFTSSVGFQVADRVTQLVSQIRSIYRKVILVGYSIGATIAWLSAAHAECDGLIGYYGSRIRDYMNLTPTCPTLLLFASQESSFDPAEIVKAFETRETVTALLLHGSHGFCDPYAGSYHPESADDAKSLTQKFIAQM